jgi:hypothetical protein
VGSNPTLSAILSFAMTTATDTTLTIGDQAPDLIYRTREGADHHLAEAWTEGPALLVWLRHFG